MGMLESEREREREREREGYQTLTSFPNSHPF